MVVWPKEWHKGTKSTHKLYEVKSVKKEYEGKSGIVFYGANHKK